MAARGYLHPQSDPLSHLTHTVKPTVKPTLSPTLSPTSSGSQRVAANQPRRPCGRIHPRAGGQGARWGKYATCWWCRGRALVHVLALHSFPVPSACLSISQHAASTGGRVLRTSIRKSNTFHGARLILLFLLLLLHFSQFAEREGAERALQLHNCDLNGRQISVEPSTAGGLVQSEAKNDGGWMDRKLELQRHSYYLHRCPDWLAGQQGAFRLRQQWGKRERTLADGGPGHFGWGPLLTCKHVPERSPPEPSLPTCSPCPTAPYLLWNGTFGPQGR